MLQSAIAERLSPNIYAKIKNKSVTIIELTLISLKYFFLFQVLSLIEQGFWYSFSQKKIVARMESFRALKR